MSAKVIADSKFGETRLITLEVELHRLILPEQNTHRSLSRNYQSSRAVPVLRQLEQIANNPAMPVYYGSEKPGMVAGDELTGTDLELAKMIIIGMRDACLNGVKQLQKLGLHKQTASRYVEPWMYTKGVVTATEKAWLEFLKLRLHKDAQPEIKALAEKIYEAIVDSDPMELREGNWHVPYFKGGIFPGCYIPSLESENLEAAIKTSASCCAQVSYRTLDDSLEKANKIYAMLNLPENGVYPDDPPHFSPTEHIARATIRGKFNKELSGNFHSSDFIQYRKLLEIGEENKYIE